MFLALTDVAGAGRWGGMELTLHTSLSSLLDCISWALTAKSPGLDLY
jgi:hypothetical protein